jgi:hypothetical protein
MAAALYAYDFSRTIYNAAVIWLALGKPGASVLE